MHASAAGAKARPLNAGVAVDMIVTESSSVATEPFVMRGQIRTFLAPIS
jgi:hypothetical protein